MTFPDEMDTRPGGRGGLAGITYTDDDRRDDHRRLKQLPAFRSAMATCNKLHPSTRSAGVPLTEAQRTAALAQARCIRDHGVPNFPGPTFPRTGGELFPAIPGLDPESPAFKHAAAACGLRGSVGQPREG